MHILHFPVFFLTRTGLASQSEWNTSLMNLATRSLATSLRMAQHLSSSKRHMHCLTGFEPRTRHNACSVTSRGMPGISEGFHTKTSQLAHRKSASSHSYLARSWVPIHTVLVGSVGSIPTALVSSSRQKAVEEVGLLWFGTARVDDSSSCGGELKMLVVAHEGVREGVAHGDDAVRSQHL